MKCPKCGVQTVRLGLVECKTGNAIKRGCPVCRGIWFEQLAGQCCLDFHDRPLRELMGPTAPNLGLAAAV